jgi:type II secretory pathway component PulF
MSAYALIISLSVLSLLLFGAGLLWTSHVLALRGEPARHMPLLGWIALLLGSLTSGAGLLHVGMLPVGLVAAIAVGVSCSLYRRSQNHMLLWSVGCAARHGVPLVDVLRSLSQEHLGRCEMVAARVEAGEPPAPLLIRALRITSVDDIVGLFVGAKYGRFDALADAFTPEAQQERQAFDRMAVTLLYGLFVSAALIAVVTYIAVALLPQFLSAFGTLSLGAPASELPWATRLWLLNAEWIYRFRFLLLLLLLPSMALSLLILARFVGWLPVDTPWMRRWGKPLDRACLLRALATSVEAQRSLPEALRFLGTIYPKSFWRPRLQTAAEEIERGAEWSAGLQRAGLLSRSDAAVIRSAQRAGNLSWAFRELASARRRRYAYACQIFYQLTVSLGLCLLGLAILITGLAIFVPLIELLQGLAA